MSRTVASQQVAGVEPLGGDSGHSVTVGPASIIDMLDEGVVTVDLSGRVTYANPAARAALQLDVDAAGVDAGWWKPLAARHQDSGVALTVGSDVIETGLGVRDVAVEVDLPDGTRSSLSINSLPSRGADGAVNGLVLSFRDTTERRRRDRALRETGDRLREAHEVAMLASWQWDPDTDEVLVFHTPDGPGPESGSRTPLEELLRRAPADTRAAMRAEIAAFEDGQRDESVRRFAEPSSSGPRWLEIRSRAVRDADGRLECIRGTSQDVTAQELAKGEVTGARDFLQATLDSLPAQIAVLGAQGDLVMTNRAWVQFGTANGGSACSAAQGNYLAACDSARGDRWADRAAAGVRALICGAESAFSLEYPCHGPEDERWFLMRAARFEGPGDARVVIAHDDVTARHLAESQVATQAALLDEVDVAVVATDLAGRVTYANHGAERLYGWTPAEAVGRSVRDLVAPSERPRTEGVVAELRRVGRWEGQLLLERKDGTTFPAYVRERLMGDGDGRPAGTIGVSVDMTERVASERALLAARNHLRAVTDSMGEGLFTLDSDGRLDYMNEAAEQLLGWPLDVLRGRAMHEVIQARRPDGSALAFAGSPIAQVRVHGRTVRESDDVFVRRDGSTLPVAYTAAPFETDEGVEGCVVVFADITERKARETVLQQEADTLSWIGRIQDALMEDRFVLYAQPIVDLASGKTVQRELLLRLQEDDGSVVAPGAFLDVAERYGLISDIDRWVVERGAEIAAGGQPVEVNISARSIGDPAMLEHIEQCLDRSAVDPRLLVFEITETAIADDAETAQAFAEQLRRLGCKLALDDFGTGFGGLTYLKNLPLDFLKIDIEFVRDLTTNPRSRHVVQAVIALARDFELQTVAEGVEDGETLDLLAQLGVDFAQGYFIARPAPLDGDAAA